MSFDDGSASGGKKIITIIIVVIVVLGFGYFLLKISPQEDKVSPAGYNSSVSQNQNAPVLSAPPAFDPATDHYLGNPKAKNVFIEYADMQCPYCATYSPILKQIPDKFTDTVFVFRYFPLLQHANTVQASLAAESAGNQGKFWEMHDLLFEKQADWETIPEPMDTFVKYAQQVGVGNIDQFKSDIINKKNIAVLQKGEDEAYGLKLQGTPSYFYNGHAIEINSTLDGLKQEAEQFRNK